MEMVKASIINALIVNLLDFVFTLLKLFVVTVLIAGTLERIRDSTSESQPSHHLFSELCSVSFVKLLRNVLSKSFDILHIIFIHYVLSRQI